MYPLDTPFKTTFRENYIFLLNFFTIFKLTILILNLCTPFDTAFKIFSGKKTFVDENFISIKCKF